MGPGPRWLQGNHAYLQHDKIPVKCFGIVLTSVHPERRVGVGLFVDFGRVAGEFGRVAG